MSGAAGSTGDRKNIVGSAVYSNKLSGKGGSSGVSNSTQNKRTYLYCIDTRQIINMINYSIEMISVPCKTINQTIEKIEKQQKNL